MPKNKHIRQTPWDTRVFGFKTYEILKPSRDVFENALRLKGHFTVKVRPYFSKKILHDYGFYYCDTLIEPYCSHRDFKYAEHKKAGIIFGVDMRRVLPICRGAFYGRFHRDFNIKKALADARYNAWLSELCRKKSVFGLSFDGRLVGFFGFSKNRIVLHAISKRYRGKGLAKYLWSVACKELFKKGYKELSSSVSASNLAALRLYASIGFKFRNPIDVYHKLNKPKKRYGS